MSVCLFVGLLVYFYFFYFINFCFSGTYRFFDGVITKATLETVGRNVSGTGRRYLFEGLQRNRSPIWDDMDFWDFCFLDSVAAEREAAGMDVNPVELIARFVIVCYDEIH